MYVEINARSENDEGPLSRNGKTTWVNEDFPNMKIATTAPEHIGSPSWHIEIKAENSFFDGGYTGEMLTTTRKSSIDLRPEDVSTLINLAWPFWVREADLHKRKKIAFDLLQELDDTELLSFLSELLPSRPSTKV